MIISQIAIISLKIAIFAYSLLKIIVFAQFLENLIFYKFLFKISKFLNISAYPGYVIFTTLAKTVPSFSNHIDMTLSICLDIWWTLWRLGHWGHFCPVSGDQNRRVENNIESIFAIANFVRNINTRGGKHIINR